MFYKIFVLIFLLVSSIVNSDLLASLGGILVEPQRVVFDDKAFYKEINIINTSKEKSEFRLELYDYRVTPDGKLKKLEPNETVQDGELFASNIVFFSPRNFKLNPGDMQIVRFKIRDIRKLYDNAEYRSRIKIKRLPIQEKKNEEEVDQNTLSFSIKPIFVLDIPIFIHVGDTFVKVDVDDPHTKVIVEEIEDLEGKSKKLIYLALQFLREGNASSSGDVFIYHDSYENVIGGTRAFLVNPYDKLDLKIALNMEIEDLYKKPEFYINYSRSNSSGDVEESFWEGKLILNKQDIVHIKTTEKEVKAKAVHKVQAKVIPKTQ